ncbi:MAG: hypothetical protein AAB522_01195 [Patescibacteria group bacterium]
MGKKLKVFFAHDPYNFSNPEHLIINAFSEEGARKIADEYRDYNHPIFRDPSRTLCKCVGYALENSKPGVIK